MRKGLKIFLSVLVLIVVVGLVIAAGIGSRDNVTGKWFQQPDVTKWFYSWGKEKDDHSDDNIAICSFTLEQSDFAAYGISEQALKAGVLTAEYTPANTTNKRTGWTWRWAGTHSDWSTGKNIADYVKFTAGANYAPELTYEVLQAFGDTIIVEATSRANSALKATTNIDYLAKYTAIWDDGCYTLAYGEDLDFLSGLYTQDECFSIEPDSYVVRSARLEYSSSFYEYLSAHTDWENEVFDYSNTNVLEWNKFVYPAFEEQASGYYTDTGWIDIFDASVTIDCYYKGEIMYTFSDCKTLEFSSTALQEMATPPTNITIPGGGQVIV